MTSRPDRVTAMSGPAGSPSPEAVALDHSFDADGLYSMRAAVAAHASELGADSERLEHLLIVASELANNAIRHGGGSGRLRLWRTGDRIHCEVSDKGSGSVAADTGTSPPDPGQIGGRGLWISRQLSDRLDIATGAATGGGTVVTAVLAVRSPADPPQPRP